MPSANIPYRIIYNVCDPTIWTPALTKDTVEDNKIYRALYSWATQSFLLAADKTITNIEYHGFEILGYSNDTGFTLTIVRCKFYDCIFDYSYDVYLEFSNAYFENSRLAKTIWLKDDTSAYGRHSFIRCFFGDEADSTDLTIKPKTTTESYQAYFEDCTGDLTFANSGATGVQNNYINGHKGTITIASTCGAATVVRIRGGSGLVINQSATATVTYNGVTVPNGTTKNIPATVNDTDTIAARIGAFTGTGINTILGFFKALFKKDAAAPSDIAGTFDPASDSVEALAESMASEDLKLTLMGSSIDAGFIAGAKDATVAKHATVALAAGTKGTDNIHDDLANLAVTTGALPSKDAFKNLMLNRTVMDRHANGKPKEIAIGNAGNEGTVDTTLDPATETFIETEVLRVEE
jgi:hypothetical protein